MQAMKMKRLVPTYVLALALAIGVVSGGTIVASALYLSDQASDSTSVTAAGSISRPPVHRPMDERAIGSSDGAHLTRVSQLRDRADEISTLKDNPSE